ncbi:MAG: hypothetical protein AB1497_10180 [Bacillota bacterium]
MMLEDNYWAEEIQESCVYVDGEQVPFSRETVKQAEGCHEEKWAVWDMTFKEGITRVDVVYEAPFDAYRLWADVSFWYVLHTGRYWADTTGSVKITLSLPDSGETVRIQRDQVRQQTTPDWRLTDEGLVLEFRDIEPDFLGPVLFTRRLTEPKR